MSEMQKANVTQHQDRKSIQDGLCQVWMQHHEQELVADFNLRLAQTVVEIIIFNSLI